VFDILGYGAIDPVTGPEDPGAQFYNLCSRDAVPNTTYDQPGNFICDKGFRAEFFHQAALK